MPSRVGPTGLRVYCWFGLGGVWTSGCINPSHKCEAKAILGFKNFVDRPWRYTLAYDREMSHFVALAASCVCRWAVLLARGVSAVAIPTVPATCLEGLPLEVSLVPLLCILTSMRVLPVPSRCDALNLRFLIRVTHVLLLPSKTGFSLPFRVKGLLPRHRVLACNCLPCRKR